MSKYGSEEEMLKHYNPKKYRTPDGYTSDIAVFTIITTKHEEFKPPEMSLRLMLIRRSLLDKDGEPHIEGGKWALPGGFIRETETAYEAAKRELEEETGVSGIHIKHFGVYDKPGRDKRGWIISNAHYAIVPEYYLEKRKAADDAEDVDLFSLEEVFQLDLAFDHHEIIGDALNSIKRDMIQTAVAKNFLPEEFTLSELQRVLLTVIQNPAIESDAAFYRKAPKLPFLELVIDKEGVPKKTTRTSKKPTNLYRFKNAAKIPSIYD